ncbi:hypothetical protein [Prosthecobacter debontii]|uniref:hypothetical protein n=1 Tax=Prosthecobacter debontii TaxID=48467 RepID=UPI00158FF501|nr:hypothetical protein [Prosthecobacter debontii]
MEPASSGAWAGDKILSGFKAAQASIKGFQRSNALNSANLSQKTLAYGDTITRASASSQWGSKAGTTVGNVVGSFISNATFFSDK